MSPYGHRWWRFQSVLRIDWNRDVRFLKLIPNINRLHFSLKRNDLALTWLFLGTRLHPLLRRQVGDDVWVPSLRILLLFCCTLCLLWHVISTSWSRSVVAAGWILAGCLWGEGGGEGSGGSCLSVITSLDSLEEQLWTWAWPASLGVGLVSLSFSSLLLAVVSTGVGDCRLRLLSDFILTSL